MPAAAPSPGERSPGDGPADAQLVERVKRGDAGAFDALMARHLARAYGFAYRLLGHREDAEDLVQDVFLTLLEKVDTFQEGREFAPWFYRILANRAMSRRRSRATRRTEPLPEDAAVGGPSPARHAEQADTGARVREAVDALPDRQRVIVELFELEGWSGPEIARMLDVSPATVRWHLHEARRTLRETLAPLERKEP
jgi:RNA polymerase sigma-70 factor, ECF subfamily